MKLSSMNILHGGRQYARYCFLLRIDKQFRKKWGGNLMWKKKISKNKRQYLLFGLIVFLTISVFSMCFSFVVELGEYTNSLLDKDNSSDVYIMTMNDLDLEDCITDDDVYDNIASYNLYEGYSVNAPIKFDDQNISMLFQSALKMGSIDDMPEFTVVESKNDEKVPKEGEIWLPMILSDPCGIELGDTITLDYDDQLKLEVTGIYKAKVLITQNLGFAPVIMSDEDLEAIASEETPIRLYGMNLDDSRDDAITDLKDSCKGMSFSVTRTQLRSNFQQVANVISNMGVIAAVIIFIAALAIIRYVISNNIIQEYKSIGIYKSLGYTDRQISNFYINGYMLVGAIAASVGSVALLPVVQRLGDVCTKYADAFQITENTAKTISSTIGLFMLLIYINVSQSLKIIKKRSAVEIIRSKQAMGVKKIAKSKIKNASSALSISVNTLFKHKGATFLSAFAFMFAVHLALIFIMIGYSAYKMDDNYNKWFAIPENDGYVSGILDDDVIDYLDDSDDLESYVYGSLCKTILVKSDSTDQSMNLFNFDILSNTDPKVTGVSISGDYAVEEDEVVLTTKAMAVLGTRIGDEIDLTINDTEMTYKIVGTYSSMFGSYGIMMTVDAMEAVNSDYTPTYAFINLKNGASIDSFKDDMTDEFSRISVDENWFAIDTAMGATRIMLLDISLLLVVVFLVFTIISLSIVISINIENKVREGGILKALGFTGNYIMAMNIYSSLITAGIGTLLAFILHMALSKPILAMFMVDAFENPMGLICIYIVTELLIAVFVTFLMNRRVRNVSPKVLMEE